MSYWFKQDEIHAHTHVHGCPAFLPWHRELINRFEELIQEIASQGGSVQPPSPFVLRR